jgi:hypothetical protein
MVIQFSELSPAELRPFLRVVPKPAAQGIARGYVLDPGIDAEVGTFDSARP